MYADRKRERERTALQRCHTQMQSNRVKRSNAIFNERLNMQMKFLNRQNKWTFDQCAMNIAQNLLTDRRNVAIMNRCAANAIR